MPSRKAFLPIGASRKAMPEIITKRFLHIRPLIRKLYKKLNQDFCTSGPRYAMQKNYTKDFCANQKAILEIMPKTFAHPA